MSGQKYREANPRTNAGGSDSRLKEALKSRVTWVASIFLLGYVGAEVALGGWIVTFMRRERGGGDFESGIVATGFWTGITVGRLVLGFVTPRLGEKFAVLVSLLVLLGCRQTNPNVDVHRVCHGLPAHVLVGAVLPRFRDFCCAPRLLPRPPFPSHHSRCDQGATSLSSCLGNRICSCIWWWRRSDFALCNRFSRASQGRCRVATNHPGSSRCAVAAVVLLPETGQKSGWRDPTSI